MKRRNAVDSGAPWQDRSICPDCGNDLVERINRKKGNKFIGCTTYPTCRYTRPWTRKMWKDPPDTYNADWRVMERVKAERNRKSGDIHCPRCDVGLLTIMGEPPAVRCSQCDYKEAYG